MKFSGTLQQTKAFQESTIHEALQKSTTNKVLVNKHKSRENVSETGHKSQSSEWYG